MKIEANDKQVQDIFSLGYFKIQDFKDLILGLKRKSKTFGMMLLLKNMSNILLARWLSIK
jgi:hypothetical protein